MSDERSYNLFLAVALLAVLSANAACPAADVTLRPRLDTIGGLIRLGDVADIASPDAAEVERLARLPLMPAPAPGTQTTITAQGVRELIVASGEDLGALRFSGAIRVTIGDRPAAARRPVRRTFVEPETKAAEPTARTKQPTGFRSFPVAKASPRRIRVTLSRSVSTKLTADLQRQISRFAQRVTGEPMIEASNIEVAPHHLEALSRATTEVEVATTDAVAVGRRRFLISFVSDEGETRFPVHADVRRSTPAVVVVQNIPRGAMITRADVEVRPLPAETRLRAGVTLFSSFEEVVGREAGSALRPGTPLHDANCLPPMLVRRGQEVTVVAGGEGVSVRMSAQAKSDGRLGEIVPVETYDRDSKLMARVVGPRELAVLSSASGAAYTAALPRRLR